MDSAAASAAPATSAATVAAIIAAAAFLASAAAGAFETRLSVVETEKVARSPAVVTMGVPFPKGAVKDVSRLAARLGGKTIPAQFVKTVSWDDGSARWALMDAQLDIPAGGRAELVVSDSGGNPPPPSPVRVETAGAGGAKVSSGPMEFAIGGGKPGLFASLKVDGKEKLAPSGRGLVLWKEDGGEAVAGPPEELRVEQAGPMRATVLARGKFPGVHKDLLGYTARISAFAGRRFVKIHLWLENHGAMGYYAAKDEGGTSPNIEWFAFDGMAVELAPDLGGKVAATCEGAEGTGSFKVYQFCHMARGQEKVQYKKGPFYTWKDFEYVISADGKELKRGERTEGVVALKGDGGTLTAAVRDFWQNYEKAIELDGGTLRLWLWPREGQWPRARPDLKGGGLFDRTLQNLPKDGLYFLPGGVHKGYEFILDFSGRDGKETWAELSAPAAALASAEYYASTEAAPGLFAPPEVRTADKDCNAKLSAWCRMARSAADPASPSGLPKAVETPSESIVSYVSDSTYWFGWMDYGDLPVPGRGPVCLHYDWTWIMLINAMRFGDPAFLRIGTAMARHRIDVDQNWSDRDPPETRGLQRGDYNFPSFHCYRLYRYPGVSTNWIAGVALYYMLTGEPKAMECCLRNGEGLRAGWEHIAKTKPWGGPQGNVAANAWAVASWCALYDLTADRKWLDDALNLFNTNISAIWKVHGPHLHNPNDQIRGQDYQKEDMNYCYAIASLCELHRHTGDEKVFKLLSDGCAKPFPDSFFEAPLFLADLFAYVGARIGIAEYLATAADLFAQSFPESKCPPVWLPDNSTWSRTSAMALRAGHILQWAWWKSKPPAK